MLRSFRLVRGLLPDAATLLQSSLPPERLKSFSRVGAQQHKRPLLPGRYRQAIDYQDSSCLMTKEILLPRHLNLDMTIFCFLSGLCLRAKILKFN